jgi:hypothetical protein
MKNALEYDETGGQGKACKTNSEGVCVYQDKEKKKKVKKDEKTGHRHQRRLPGERVHREREEDARGVRHVPEVREGREGPRAAQDRLPPGEAHDGATTSSRRPARCSRRWSSSSTAPSTRRGAPRCSSTSSPSVDQQGPHAGGDPQGVGGPREVGPQDAEDEGLHPPRGRRAQGRHPALLAGIGWKKGMAYRDAGAAGDPNGFRMCAEQFLTVYNEYGDEHEKASTLIYNAASATRPPTCSASRSGGASSCSRSSRQRALPEDAVEPGWQLPGHRDVRQGRRAHGDLRGEVREGQGVARLPAQRLPVPPRPRPERPGQRQPGQVRGPVQEGQPELAAKIFWSKHDILKTDEEKLSTPRST